MKKKELEKALEKKTAQVQVLKLELNLCKLGLSPEQQRNFLAAAIKQYKLRKKS